MLNVRYTIRGLDLFDVNPQLVSDLERVASTLYNVSVNFPDFNYYEEAVGLMQGVNRGDDIKVGSVWARTRFRFDNETRIDSFRGVLIEPPSNDQIYLQLAPKIPEQVSSAQVLPYDSETFHNLTHRFVSGNGLDQMVIDRGVEYDTVYTTMRNGTKMGFFYRGETFIGFDIDEALHPGIKYIHYILRGVDPSIYVPDAIRSDRNKDVVVNEGLVGEIRPLLQDQEVSYQQPKLQPFDYTQANVGDQYLIIFRARNGQIAQHVYQSFREAWEFTGKPTLPFDPKMLTEHTGLSIAEPPRFTISMKADRNPASNYYSLILTLCSKGPHEYRDDFLYLLTGAILGEKSRGKVEEFHVEKL